jgi:NTP pyrophosphatase (non-canonical NTP hydrolase)
MQNKVTNFNNAKNAHLKPMPAYARILDIESEIGELGKEYLKGSGYGTEEFKLHDDFIMEYGDVLYSMLSLADELNINAEDALDKVIEKYRKRLLKGSMGSEVE